MALFVSLATTVSKRALFIDNSDNYWYIVRCMYFVVKFYTKMIGFMQNYVYIIMS